MLSTVDYHDPAPLPDGSGESCARCATCGTPYIPQDSRNRFCSQQCADRRRNAAHYRLHAAARQARVAVRRAGHDPTAEPWRSRLAALRGRGVVEGWREEMGLPAGRAPRAPLEAPTAPDAPTPVPAPRSPWTATVGPQPEHITPVGIPLALSARLPTRDATRRHLHGLVSHLVGRDHHRTLAAWALVPYGQAWAVVAFVPEAAERLRGVAREVQVGGVRATLTTPTRPVRLRAPPSYAPGRYRVTIEALSLVVHYADGRTVMRPAPRAETILSVASAAILYAGTGPVGRLHVESVDVSDAHVDRVELGGHLGVMRGWTGRVVVECNAPAAWALKLCEHTGMGGRVAYGLGRVRVTVEAVAA